MSLDLAGELAPVLREQTSPGTGAFYSVALADLRALARREGLSPRQAMIACLEQGIWPECLRSNRGSFDAAQQAALLGGRAAVIGAGGLGGVVIAQLARLGVGGLAVCDADVFEESNLNRQSLATLERLGRNKAMAAAEHLASIAPHCEVSAFAQWADHDSLPLILRGCGVAVDCLDNHQGRYALEKAARQAGIPMIHGAIGGMEGMLMRITPASPGLADVYGPTPPEKQGSAEMLLGMPPMTPAVVGALQALEAARCLLDLPGLPPGRLLHVDLDGPELELIG